MKHQIIALIMHSILWKKNLQDVGRGPEMSTSFIFYRLHRTTAIDYGKRFLKDKLVIYKLVKI